MVAPPHPHSSPTLSLVMTVLNEGASLPSFFQSLCQQSHLPDEIIIVDGGSQDDTLSIIQHYRDPLPIRLLEHPGCNISQGRNIGIAAASHEIILVTDAGVRLAPDWVANLHAPFTDDPGRQVVAGFFLPDPDPQHPFEVAMSATVLPHQRDIDPSSFLPSSRSIAFRKSAWESVGGYPEWLDYCEDLIFDLRLKAEHDPFHFAPEAVVYFKPRTMLGSFFKQYYRYARGDGKADLWRKRHAIRYGTYLVAAPILLLLMRKNPRWGVVGLLGGMVYMRQPLRRLPGLWGNLSLLGKLRALLWMPIIRAVGDVAKMLGYPVGWRWRLRNQPPRLEG
jgi:glycosyltransferase involved in cell wall biosynthesis